MELFYLENTKYIAKCPECSEIVLFKINYENFTVSVECKNGHNKKDLLYNDFEDNYLKPSQLYKCNCNKCFKLIRDDCINYKCNICNKLYCSNCINNHSKETNHNSNIKFIQKYQLCSKHNQKYSFFCQNCQNHFCEKCKRSHKKHITKLIIDIIPNKTKIDSIKKNIEVFQKKVDEISLTIKNYKKEIDKRFIEIEGFLQFLINIHNYLLYNFNYNFFDYYNFENFNYLFNSFKNENIFDIIRYKNYLFKENNKNKEVPDKTRKERINDLKNRKRESEMNYNYIQNLNKLEYLKENIFYVFDRNSIKFFKFENFSFSSMLFFNLEKFRIYSIQPAKYNNSILLNFEFKKNIKFLEYDLTNKTIKIGKKDIKEPKVGFPRHFYKCIDNNNGNILTQDNNGTTIWKIDEKKNYVKFLTIKDAQLSLLNINGNLFCSQDNDYNIYFYDTINYECSKIISYHKKVNLIGIINDEIIVFNNSFSSTIFLVDIKYLEIIQIIDNNRFQSLKVKDNYLLTFYMEKDYKLVIEKKEYDIKEKYFKNTEILEKESVLNSFSNILITDKDYVAILNYNHMVLLNI